MRVDSFRSALAAQSRTGGYRRLLAAAVGLALGALQAGSASADFVNGGFETLGGTSSQPFPGWLVEFRKNCNGPTAFSSTLPSGHPAPINVTAAAFNSVNIPALCGSRMARINDLVGQCHESRISQSAVLTASDIDVCGTTTVEVCWIGVFDHPTNGGHNASTEPFFEFTLEHTIASSGLTQVVDSAYYASGNATQAQSGWIAAGSGPSGVGVVYYRQTCTPLIVLDAHPGDTVKVTMTVGDCELTAHGAMAFLDCATIAVGPPSGPSSMLVPQTWSTAVVSSLGMEAGDFNADGRCDLADYLSSGSVRVLESGGASFLPPLLAASVPTNWSRLYTGDFDGDGCTDVAGWDGSSLRFVWADCATPATDFVLVQNTVVIPGGVGAGGRFWVGDWNGDGRDDLVRDDGVSIEVALATGVRAAPLSLFGANPPWQSSGSFVGGFYVCDYNGDGKSDLMQSLTTGLHFLISTGSSFYPPALWRTEGPPTGGWSVGDFDCDGRCEIIQRTSAGVLRVLDITPPPLNGKGNLTPISPKNIPAGPYAVGDFDGNGQDDLATVVTGSSVRVIKSCDVSCDCLRVDATACCDYPDRTRYALKLTISNRAGVPLNSVDIAPLGPFSVLSSNVPLVPPLPNRRTRTITVLATGLTPGVASCISVIGNWTTSLDCEQTVCFVPPPCDCMDVVPSEGYCKPDGSGSTCFDFSVTNASGVTTHFIRLQPAASFFPNIIPVVLTPGQTYTSSNCAVRILQSGSGGSIAATVELLDSGSNLVCDEAATVFYPPCPTILGECCVQGAGILSKTATECAMLGGTWTPPGVSQHCPIGSGGGGSQKRAILPRMDSFVTINEEQRTFIAARHGGSSPAADFLTTAAGEIEWSMDALDPNAPVGSGVAMLLRGGASGSLVGTLEVMNNGMGLDAAVDFGAAGADGVFVIGEGESSSYPPIALSGPVAVAALSVSPSRVRARLSELPGASHGFVLEFDQLCEVDIPGSPVMEVRELQLLSGGSASLPSLASVGFRGLDQAVIALGLVIAEDVPCLGDLTGDCLVDSADVAVFTSGIDPLEIDVNGDGMTDLVDLNIIFAALGTACPCAGPLLHPCPGDANADGIVDFTDITIELAFFNVAYPDGPGIGDADLSGVVNFSDVTTTLANWTAVCP